MLSMGVLSVVFASGFPSQMWRGQFLVPCLSRMKLQAPLVVEFL